MSTVSVVVPIYDVEPYLRRCVDSILEQDHHDLQVILVDDGSPDLCGAICDEYSRLDDRVVVIHQANAGLAAARNAGLDVATGDYISLVDADDWLDPGFVKDLLFILQASDASMAVSHLLRTSNDEPMTRLHRGRYECWDTRTALMALLGTHHTLLTVACGKLYRAELFRNIRFPVGRVHEDEFTSHHLLAQCARVAVAEDSMYFYRQRGDSIMGRGISLESATHALDAYRERERFLAGNADADVAQDARKQLFRKGVHVEAWMRANGYTKEAKGVREELLDIANRLEHKGVVSRYSVFSWLLVRLPFLARGLLRANALIRESRASWRNLHAGG